MKTASEHALAIREATKALNLALSDAYEAQLKVDAGVFDLQTVGKRFPCIQIRVGVFQALPLNEGGL